MSRLRDLCEPQVERGGSSTVVRGTGIFIFAGSKMQRWRRNSPQPLFWPLFLLFGVCGHMPLNFRRPIELHFLRFGEF